MHFDCRREEELPGMVSGILEAYPDQRIFLFSGDLGVGKTTMIKEFCRQLGVADSVMSPTFPIIHPYQDKENRPVYHMDLYRIPLESQLVDLGFEDYLHSGYFCMIEWPDIAQALLPDKYVRITITLSGKERKISTKAYERNE